LKISKPLKCHLGLSAQRNKQDELLQKQLRIQEKIERKIKNLPKEQERYRKKRDRKRLEKERIKRIKTHKENEVEATRIRLRKNYGHMKNFIRTKRNGAKGAPIFYMPANWLVLCL